MNKNKRQWIFVLALAEISAVLLYLKPYARAPFGSTVTDYTLELITIVLVSLLSLVVEKFSDPLPTPERT